MFAFVTRLLGSDTPAATTPATSVRSALTFESLETREAPASLSIKQIFAVKLQAHQHAQTVTRTIASSHSSSLGRGTER